MEANSDKRIREKLQSIEAPFDPQAWEQMDGILDERKKRRRFFWWWFTGSIAAGVLLFTAGYEFRNITGANTLLVQNMESAVSEFKTGASSSGATPNSGTGMYSSAEKNNSSTLSISGNVGNDNEAIATTATHKNEQLLVSENTNDRNPSVRQSNRKQQMGAIGTAKNGNSITKRKAEPTTETAIDTSLLTQEKGQAAEFSTAEASSSTNVVSANTSLSFAPVILSRREADNLPSVSEEEISITRTDEENTLPKKKRVFHYSLGVLANVTGTALGNQESVETGRSYFFHKQPSFAVGFTHDFLFFNRFALSNSVLYANTGLSIESPVAQPDSSAITNSYSSVIRELQIPLGIKIYPVLKNGFRFSLSAGFIHHIKLSEVFTVKKELIPSPNPPQNVSDENTFTTVLSNSFLPSTEGGNILIAENSDINREPEYFGMGGLKRYYASFYASAGLEYMAKKHFVFFAEPLFYMSLRKVGLQQQHKYNLGANAGFRYQF